MTLAHLSGLLRGAAPLGHLTWWTGVGAATAAEVRIQWVRADLPPVTEALPGALEQTMRALHGVPLLEQSGVFWLAPGFEPQLAALREVLPHFRGWELHTVPVRATADTLAALRASASRALEERLSRFSAELEALLSQPRERASLLVRRLDALEALRRQAELHARYLSLAHEGLAPRLAEWARRIDAALCARIVA